MPIYDEYQIVINEGQRRVIMRALTNALDHELDMVTGGTIIDVLDTIVDLTDLGSDRGGTLPVTLFHERPHA
jgi:hypothetical protein